MKSQKELATKVVYATLGAPVVITRQVRELGGKQVKELSEKFAGYSDKLTETAHTTLGDYAVEGEKVAKQIRGNHVVEDLQSRVDLDKVTDRVEKLRDQLEAAMQSWRESFNPGEAKAGAKKVVVEADKPVTTSVEKAVKATPAKTTARKSAAKTTAGKPAAKTTAGKTSAGRTSTGKATASN